MNNKTLKLAIKTLDLILETIECGADWSLLLRQYNELIEEYNLNLKKIRWISLTEYEFID